MKDSCLRARISARGDFQAHQRAWAPAPPLLHPRTPWGKESSPSAKPTVVIVSPRHFPALKLEVGALVVHSVVRVAAQTREGCHPGGHPEPAPGHCRCALGLTRSSRGRSRGSPSSSPPQAQFLLIKAQLGSSRVELIHPRFPAPLSRKAKNGGSGLPGARLHGEEGD